MLRAFVRANPGIAVLLVAMALLLRVVVPGGFMPTMANGQLTVTICTGIGPAQITVPMPGAGHKPGAHKAQNSCAFADLSVPSLAGAVPIQLAELIAFILALGLTLAVAVPPLPAGRLRPPLRGPPLHA